MRFSKNLSLLVLVTIGVILSIYRITNVNTREISWDVLGYYLPLPAIFIYNDPMLTKTDWLKKINDEKKLTGTLYMVSTTDKGEPMYFFLFGMAFFYLPFFCIGHIFASFSGIADGFSLPYQYALVIGGIMFTLIGLFYLRKNLKYFFSEGITAIVMLILVFSTNYIHHLTLKNLEPVNVLFMLVNIVLWYTIKWHEQQKLKFLIITGVGISLMALIKPSEIIILLIPVLWNLHSGESFKEKIHLILDKKRQLFITIIICLLLAIPQLLYWLVKTGSPIYDSYKNPGIGLDFLSPHIVNVLFSYRKGWLLYTPVMVFSLIGFYFLYKNNKKIFFALFAYFILSFYIISSWSEWWYGAGFSNRPLITVYPVLAISLGYFLVYIGEKGTIVKSVFLTFVLFLTFLNQFQWWQLKNYVLDPYHTTKGYYWATFLRTTVRVEDKKFLLINRDFNGKMSFDNPNEYRLSMMQELTFEDKRTEDGIVRDENGNNFYRLSQNQEFALTRQFMYSELTKKDHLWAVVSFDVRYPEKNEDPLPCLVTTMEHKGKSYGYAGFEIKPDSIQSQWVKCRFEYLTPEIRNVKDDLKIYIWKRGKESFDIDNFKVEIFEKISN